MAFSFEATHGTTFLFNKGLAGNVTIIRGTEQITVPGGDLLEFLAGTEKGGGKMPPYLERAPDTGQDAGKDPSG